MIKSVLVFCLLVVITAGSALGLVEVLPMIETEQVVGTGDNADDLAIWIHPADPNLSVIVGQSKATSGGGMHVFDLTGEELQFLPDGRMNNIDLRYNIKLAGQYTDIVTAGNRTNNSIAIYKINPDTRMLENIACRVITSGISIYGSCMYRSPMTGKLYVFVNSKTGEVEQWELFDDGTGLIDAVRVSQFDAGTQTEGCVADDEYGCFYIGEENVGIWKYGAEPDAGDAREQVDSTAGGYITADVEGLTIYYGQAGTGYLIASSQGSSQFVVYERRGGNAYVKSFKVIGNTALGIDACTGTDGIDVVNVSLGSLFPHGLFIAHDTTNTGGTCSNYKLVDWQQIATAGDVALDIDLSWNPRGIRGDFNGDMLIDIEDLQELTQSWLSGPEDADWSTACDISIPPDGLINLKDMAEMLKHL